LQNLSHSSAEVVNNEFQHLFDFRVNIIIFADIAS